MIIGGCLIILELTQISQSLSKCKFLCSLSDHIGSPNQVDYLAYNDHCTLRTQSNLFLTHVFLVSICDFTSKHIPLKYNCPYYCRVRAYLWMKVESSQSALARLIWDIQFHFKIQLIKVQKDLTIELIYAILPSPWISLRRHHKTLPMALWCLCKLIHHG